MDAIFQVPGRTDDLPPLRLLADGESFIIADHDSPVIEGRRSASSVDLSFHTPTQSHVVPPITARQIRRHGSMAPADRTRSWLHHFTRAMISSTWSPLHRGRWLLEAVPSPDQSDHRVRSRRATEAMVAFGPPTSRPLDTARPPLLLPVRHWPDRTSSRVKAMRKFASEAIPLPPVLIWWVSQLESYIVLDGHSRLVAAALDVRALDFFSLDLLSDADDPGHQRELIDAYEIRVAELVRAASRGNDRDGVTIQIAEESQRLARLLGRQTRPSRAWSIE